MYVIEDIKILIVIILNLQVIWEEYYHFEIPCLQTSEQDTCLFQLLSLVLWMLPCRLSFWCNYRVQGKLTLPVIYQLTCHSDGGGLSSPQLGSFLWCHTCFSLIVTLSSFTTFLCTSTFFFFLQNLGRRVLNRWLFWVLSVWKWLYSSFTLDWYSG